MGNSETELQMVLDKINSRCATKRMFNKTSHKLHQKHACHLSNVPLKCLT
jgi:hypothetical protein